MRTLAGLSLAGINDRALQVHPEVRLKDVKFKAQSKEARQKFVALETKKLATLHADFIKACGGKPGVGRKITTLKGAGSTNSTGSLQAGSTYNVTLTLLKSGRSLADIAKERSMALSTIVGHIEKLSTEKKIIPDSDLAHLKRPQRFEQMKKALEAVHKKEGKMLLSPARALLDQSYNYEELRLARLFLY